MAHEPGIWSAAASTISSPSTLSILSPALDDPGTYQLIFSTDLHVAVTMFDMFFHKIHMTLFLLLSS